MAKESFDFEDGFGNYFDEAFFTMFGGRVNSKRDKSEKEIRESALIEMFRMEASNGDKEYLSRVLEDYSSEVLREDSTDRLVRAYILASLEVEDFKLSSQGFRFIQEANVHDFELEGLVQFNRGLDSSAITFFKKSGEIGAQSRIAYSAAMQRENVFDLQPHYALLNPLSDKVSLANTLFGTACYNVQDFDRAEESFRKAKELNLTERTALDFLRVRKRQGVNVYGDLNEFYVTTESKMGSQELLQNLDVKEIPVPTFKVSGLSRLAMKLWN
jgi:hypothetical protein